MLESRNFAVSLTVKKRGQNREIFPRSITTKLNEENVRKKLFANRN